MNTGGPTKDIISSQWYEYHEVLHFYNILTNMIYN